MTGKRQGQKKRPQRDEEDVSYVCLSCRRREGIPLGVVLWFDEMDEGDRSVPPRFRCEHCGGEMRPEEEWEALAKRIRGMEQRT